MELQKSHFRSMIFYDFKRGPSADQSLANLTTAFGDKAPSRATVFRCFYEFRSGRTSFEDEERSGRPHTALTPDNIAAVELMLREDCRIMYDTL